MTTKDWVSKARYELLCNTRQIRVVTAWSESSGKPIVLTGIATSDSDDGFPFSPLLEAEEGPGEHQVRLQASLFRTACLSSGEAKATRPVAADVGGVPKTATGRGSFFQKGRAASAKAAHEWLVSEELFAARFRCPETYPDEGAQKKALSDMVGWYFAAHEHATIRDLVNFRLKLLERQRCSRTLANIRQADR